MAQQQGDVRIVKVKELPQGLKKVNRQEKGYILAEGEVTGHVHVIQEEVDLYQAEDGTLYLCAEIPVTLHHEEHQAQTIEPGTYRIKRVREKDWLNDMVRQVKD